MRGEYPYQNPELTVEQRVADLMGRMTRAEKIGQLNQIFLFPSRREEALRMAREGKIGSFLAVGGFEGERRPAVADLNEMQRAAVEGSRLGIPMLYGRDVIHGHRTVFPIPLGMAAAFDEELVEAGFATAAREAASAGVHWSFAPMVDIARDPRWGRIIEGFGEDPYLCGKLAAAAVRGYQGDDLSDPERILACAKHFIGYGAAEGGRDYETSEISENTLRNLYLPPYRAAVEAGVATVMSSFQDLNGEPVSGSQRLVDGLLKGELGFDGFVISDWASIQEIAHHRVAADDREATRIGFNAGVDMDMVDELYLTYLDGLIESGEVSEARLDDAVRRVLTAKFRLGLFDRPYTDPELAGRVLFSAAHQAQARRTAARCMVLLKNDGGLLPLAGGVARIAVVGPLAHDREALLGSWSFDGDPADAVPVFDALQAALPEAELIAAPDTSPDQMLAAIQRADLAVLVVGESAARNGENANVMSIDLPAGQSELVEAACRMGRPVVLVVIAGRPLALTREAELATAILWAWQPGTMGGQAIADALTGAVEPGGRLPVSFPRATGQIPVYYNFKSSGKIFDLIYRPQVPPGYRHLERYLDGPSAPLYPFGFGLSYTTFAYSNLTISAEKIAPGETVTAAVTVTNTGERSGEAVAQLYVQDVAASVTRPVRELKGFRRVLLQPGESQRVEFVLGPAELSLYNQEGRFVLEPGRFKVWAGGDCRAGLEGEFEIV